MLISFSPFQKAMAGECSELQAVVLRVGGVRLVAQDEKAQKDI